jgi:hypothetical protein
MNRKINRLSKVALSAVLICGLSPSTYADGILIAWGSGDVPGVTEQSFNAAKQLSVDAVLKRNLEVATWPEAYLMMVGANQHKDDKRLLNGLVSQINNKTKVDLRLTRKLIIWERITSGEIQFQGTGYHVSDDLFTVAGRANWMLRNLMGKVFGYVKPNASDENLVALQQAWTRWLSGQQVEEYQDQYPSLENGLSEIRSLEALEALIISLKPTSQKEALTKDCLKRIYNTDKLPDDPTSPSALCSPDPYTNRYLTLLTGIKDRHDFAWWQSWWDSNRGKLKWNRDKGAFELPR